MFFLRLIQICLCFSIPRSIVAWSTVELGRPARFSYSSCLMRRRESFRSNILRLDAASVSYHSTYLDGPCWNSLQKKLLAEQTEVHRGPVGHLRVATGTLDDGSSVVGIPAAPSMLNKKEGSKDHVIRLESGVYLVADSIARIPKGLKSDQAAVTFAYAFTHVHSLFTVVNSVGGSDDKLATPPQNAVVVGGNEDAVRAAQALQALGSIVTLVSPNKPQVPTSKVSSSKPSVLVTNPSMGEKNLGFSEVLGQFDALLDTVGNEHDSSTEREGGVIRLLRERNKCATYMSVCTKAEEIVGREGIFFGPGKVKKYHESVVSARDLPWLSPPAKIGHTVQTLLDAGIVWSVPKGYTGGTDKPFVRSWEMGRFMEKTMWPTDNRGAATTRFGFPVPGDLAEEKEMEFDDDLLAKAAKAPISDFMVVPGTRARDRDGLLNIEMDEGDEDDDEPDDDGKDFLADGPEGKDYVVQISNARGLKTIVEKQLTCVLFISAKFCRTCRKMQSPYRRMARISGESYGKGLIFAKGEAAGEEGKFLGELLGVKSVPTFVLFKKGRRYGKPLGISKLPSKKLETAIEYLKDDKPWDDKVFHDSDEGQKTRSKL